MSKRASVARKVNYFELNYSEKEIVENVFSIFLFSYVHTCMHNDVI